MGARFRTVGIVACLLAQALMGGAKGGVTEVVKTPVGLEVTVSLRDGKFLLGELPARMQGDKPVSVEYATLLLLLRPVLNEQNHARLAAVTTDKGFVPLRQMENAGLPLAYDGETLSLTASPAVEQRPRGLIMLAAPADSGGPDTAPASFSGYTNVRAGVTRTTTKHGSAETHISAAFDSAIRYMGIVIENEAGWNGDTVVRHATRLSYDDPEAALRYTAGDVKVKQVGAQSASQLAGFVIEKNYAALQPGKNIRPTGRRTFRIDRPSQVDVIVNGEVLKRLELRPGEYDLDQLPLRAGLNVLKLEITDDTGKKSTIDFSIPYDHQLLAMGFSEWQAAGGFVRLPGAFGSVYRPDLPVLMGHYDYGLLESATGRLFGQLDPHTAMGGVSGTTRLSWGSVLAEGSVSASDFGLGASFYTSFMADTTRWEWASDLQLRVSLSGTTDKFSSGLGVTPGGKSVSSSLYVGVPLPDAFNIGAWGDISFADSQTYTAGMLLSRNVTPDTAWSVQASVASQESGRGTSPSLAFVGRLTVGLGQETNLALSQDGQTGMTRLAGTTSHSGESGVYGARVGIERIPQSSSFDGNPRLRLDGGASYSGSRGEVAVNYQRDVTRLGLMRADADTLTVSGGMSVAFADGTVAVGRPIADGFAIIAPHPTLADASVAVAPSAHGPRAASDIFGPALVSDLAPYSLTRLPLAWEGAPRGYDPGSGTLTLKPAYKSGYNVTVGSEYNVVATGIFRSPSGAPVTMVSGIAGEEATNPRSVSLFTNASGHFTIQGLRKGVWRVKLATDPEACFSLTVPDRIPGGDVFDAGEVTTACK